MLKIRICESKEAINRIKWLIIFHTVLWIIIALFILLVGDDELVLIINPGFGIDESHLSYILVKIYSDTFLIVNLGLLILVIIFMSVSRLENYRRPMLEAFYSVLIAGFFIEPMKDLFARPRPFQEGSPIADQINNFGETTDSGSMPSGHVGYTGAAVLPHAIRLKNVTIAIILSLYSAGMMYIRMFMGVHYASDVLIGNIISLVSAILAFFLFELIYRRINVKRKLEWLIFFFGIIIFILQIFLRI